MGVRIPWRFRERFKKRVRRAGFWTGFDPILSGKQKVVPSWVTEICDKAFQGCKNLSNVIIPDSVTHIGTEAFADCIGLTSVAIPDSVIHIGISAFANCSALTSITISSGVT